MKVVQAPRASAILHSVLAHRADKRPWLLPANICPIVAITFKKAQVPFELVDISPATLALDLDHAIELARTHKYGGLLYAHPYGDPFTPRELFAKLQSTARDLVLIDDRCLCIPDLVPDPSSPADITLYSTGYTKIVELQGGGGYAFVKDEFEFHASVLQFDPAHLAALDAGYKRAVQERRRFVYEDSDWLATNGPLSVWVNRCQQIESALTGSLRHRQALNEIYAARLPEDWQLPDRYQTWRFNVRVPNKQRVVTSIFAAGLFASSHYASLAGDRCRKARAPHCEDLADEIVNLFNDHYFTAEQAERICDIVLEAAA